MDKSQDPQDLNLDTNTSFEDAYNKLEETTKKLETGNLTLEESTRLYKKGMELAKHCNELLKASELKIESLKTQYSESTRLFSTEPKDPSA